MSWNPSSREPNLCHSMQNLQPDNVTSHPNTSNGEPIGTHIPTAQHSATGTERRPQGHHSAGTLRSAPAPVGSHARKEGSEPAPCIKTGSAPAARCRAPCAGLTARHAVSSGRELAAYRATGEPPGPEGRSRAGGAAKHRTFPWRHHPPMPLTAARASAAMPPHATSGRETPPLPLRGPRRRSAARRGAGMCARGWPGWERVGFGAGT